MMKRGFLSKRAASPLTVLFEMIGAVAVLFVFTSIAHNAATSDDVKSVFLAKDSALMIDALQSLPSNAFTDYVTVSFGFPAKFKVDEEKVSVAEQYNSYFIKDLRDSILGTELDMEAGKQKTLKFGKEGNIIKVGEDISVLDKIASCPNVKTQNDDVSNVAVIADEDVKQITRLLFKGFTPVESIDAAKDAKTIIQVRKGDAGKMVAYIPFKSSRLLESRRLACLVENSMIRKNNAIDASIIPSETSVDDKIFITLEIDADPQNFAYAAESIKDAVNSYPN